MRAQRFSLLVINLFIVLSVKAYAATTTVLISAELGTSIAADLFPVTIKLTPGNVFLTEPRLLFLEQGRIGMQVRFQAYDHRPAQNIAISETGRAAFSGRIGYDPVTRQILLHDPMIDTLEFDRNSTVTKSILAQLQDAWRTQATNPMRAELPPHPYLIPFRNNIQALSYNGNNINLTVSYE